MKDEFNKKLAALNDEIAAAKTKTSTKKTNIEAQYSKFQSGLPFIVHSSYVPRFNKI